MGKTYQALKRAETEYQNKLLPLDTKELVLQKPGTTALSPYKDNRLPVPIPADKGFSEQYEVLKSNILTRFSPEKIKSMVFTGASHGDGTSTTAINFASALARDTWRSVLIVDANIWRPDLHKAFNLELTHGLSDFLSNEASDEPEPSRIENNLYFQTSGLLGARAAGLFESARFDDFLKIVSQRFDHVIIVCPPVTTFPETRVIAGKVNSVVMVVDSGKTKSPVALRVKKDLQEAGANIIGVVLNKRKFYIPDWLYKKL